MATATPRFTAVTTTGIYCRDGCPGRPLDANVVGFEFAAAAEREGFRACLRCRPYRASDPSPWTGDSELVCRAVQLLCAGALDGATEDDLGRRVGVSGRHLRRLFLQHVGATPSEVARSRRAHFARRLLDETDLPITQVAHAAGFGSERQMHRVMREIFRASPSALRARRRRSDRLVADGGLQLRLPHRPPLAWAPIRDFLAARTVDGVEAVERDTYRRTVVVAGHPAVIEVRPGDDDHLLLRAHLPRWDGLIHVVERVRRLFDLDADPAAIDGHLATDPVLSGDVQRRGGVRVVGTYEPFELVVRAVVGQQVSVGAARTILGRLAARHGRPAPGLHELGLTRCFPSAADLAGADLRRVGLGGRRAHTLAEVACRVADGRVDLEAPAADVVASLATVDGIGPWTAQYVAARLGDRDALPALDLGLRRALGGELGSGGRTTPAVLDQHARRWSPWRAYGAFRLWTAARPGG